MGAMAHLVYLIGIIGVLVGAQPSPPLAPLPVNFVAGSEFTLSSFEKAIFQADIDCDHLVNSTIDVCAELSHNWEWNPFKGYVYLNLFNNSLYVNDLSKALVSSGTPHTGNGSAPNACVELKNWPGGDLFIRVDANNYSPIIFTIDAKVTSRSASPPPISTVRAGSASSPASYHGTAVRVGSVPPSTHFRGRSFDARGGAAIVQLTPVIIMDQFKSMMYNEDVTFVLDLCLNHYQADLLLTTSIIGINGTFTQFICDGLPCVPDSPLVICSENTPLPVSSCAASLNSKPKIVYVTVHASSGALDKATGDVMSKLKFGASLKTISP